MKLFRIIGLLMIFLVIFSCGSNVTTEKTTKKDLSNYETFAYLPNTNPESAGQSYDDEEINRYVIEEINSNLREAGYTLDRENPDLLVLVSAKTDERTETRTRTTVRSTPAYATYPYTAGATAVSPYYGNYYYTGYRNFNNVVGYDTDTYEYEAGSVVVNLVDRETNETVWKGVASDRIYDETSTEVIAEMVNDIFEEYPLTES